MRIEDFLNLHILKLPSIRPRGKDLYQHIREVLFEYRDALNIVDNFECCGTYGSADFEKGYILNIDLVRTISNRIIEATISIMGKLAANSSEEAFEILEAELDERLSKDLAISLEMLRSNRHLYRFRFSDGPKMNDPQDIFHVPASKPHLIKNYRFSTRITPCLYLSSSPCLCWNELEKKQLDKCYVAKFNSTFENNDNYERGVSLLNLVDTLPFLRIEAERESHGWDGNLIRYLSIWPVIFTTSIRVKNPKDPVEYIIPQMIMRYFSERNKKYELHIHGVKYSSTKIDHIDLDSYNIAIPAEEGLTSLYSPSLTNHFKLTKPYCCDFILCYQGVSSTSEYSEKFSAIEDYLHKCEQFQINENGSIKALR